ncbi:MULTISPECIES: bifunctional diguanylate cyclase/phosphodiesterase [Rhizobium/Agrobacterium group]|jgi:diguanylate cyclase (GGDEF)-like protein/PAS domain S-box-containing protein|uniref:EAL domain-containing protein n=1 Tax=Agrobacterium tumefaciens TaxID=358 RepID=A0AAJ4T8V4_AGRTU|nr:MULTISPECIES: bifunctional diguanylate cyclase/phosphodiesterase [Rhizobium/Agrobacterium group]EHJ98680.1 GGDEF/EAL transmembrane sensory box protein [Agrobacterium tumefaciens 5A]MDP9560920.1 diguanylate cyclase (GGDEF)-like protein/PAS domain S-box-containing protein [Rhizobium nepotum]KAA3528702.1 bifunctional diguanylate cyclase/phosphodiesterase [Agrobacterium tumefaciens]MEA1840070.1 EAL domain-containing protein [Agrobacterium tumefaciens]MRH97632.1 EAL domain-containing protein [Ag
MAHSVESRFIAIVSGALLTVVAPLFTLLLTLSYHEAIRSQRNHLEILLSTNAQALARPLWDLDDDTINQITGTLVSDPVIRMVEVKDTSGQLDIIQTAGSDIIQDAASTTREVTYKTTNGVVTVGQLTVYYDDIGLLTSLSRTELAFITIFILAILTTVLAAIAGNRFMVIRPLMRLAAAIEATRRVGSRHHVDWRSKDEIGRLAKSFNEMQTQLEKEELEIKHAHERKTEIYNRTPAMLFSLDRYDRIAAVSDYWVQATGYDRARILGLNFADLIHPDDRSLFLQRKAAQHSPDAAHAGITVRFHCMDGSVMDALILEKALDSGNAHQGTYLCVMTDVTELRQSEKRNRQQAISDHLTGLFNRQGFEAILDVQIRDADRNGSELACLFIDLDRFKAINDNLGHAAGDAVLREFTLKIEPLLTPLDSASRLGGDEFAILLAGDKVEERAQLFCERICTMLDTPFEIEGNSIRLSASIGMAIYPLHAASASELLQNADMAMYTRKRTGKNGSQIFDSSIMDRAREHAELERDIAQALSDNWFEAYFQPIQDLATGQTAGFEALLRLNHPDKGLLSPATIISLAEENGTIHRIGNVILDQSIANLARLSHLPGMEQSYVAVNFSPLQFEPGLPTRIAGVLHRYGILPKRLIIEITEAVIMKDDPQIRAILNAIHQLGCRIALDDFGTGYSSLSYLSRFPVDIVKIDQSFTRSICDDTVEIRQRSRMLVEGIAAISHKMNCSVIAEGVETEEQKELLTVIGADYGQGYYFARPQPIERLIAALNADNGADRAAARQA